MNNSYFSNTAVNTDISWESEIVDQGNSLDLLEDGIHEFTVKSYERQFHDKTDKFGPCRMALITLEVATDSGPVEIKDRLYLVSSMQWRLVSFFKCVIHEDLGKQFKMPWDRITGASGIAEFGRRKYSGKDGKEHTAIDIRYLPFKAKKEAPPATHNAAAAAKNASPVNENSGYNNPFEENGRPEITDYEFVNPFAS